MAYYVEKEKYTASINGKEIKFTRVWNGHRFTDAECEKLAKGDIIQFTVKSSRKNGFIVDVTGKLEEQTYNGHQFLGFKVTKYGYERSDERELRSKLLFPTNITMDALKAQIISQLEHIFTASSYENHAYQVESFDGLQFHLIQITPQFGYPGKSLLSVLAVVKDDRIIEYLENNDYWEKTLLASSYGKRYAQLKEERKEQRIQQEKEAKEQAERDKIAAIRAREWKEIRLKDYGEYADRDEVEAWLHENCDEHFDPSKVLFKLKVYTRWVNPSHRTIEDQSRTTYYVVPMIHNFPKELIVNYFAYPIASSYIREASDYDKKIEPDVEYTIEYTLHGTD